MRILFFTDHYYPEPSAPAAHVHDRCRIWASQGHEVTVVTNHPNFPIGEVYEGYKNVWRKIDMIDGVRVVRVKTYMAENKGTVKRILDYFSYAVSSMIQGFREKKPDVVISTSPHLFAPLAGVNYAWMRRVPHVFEVRDIWPASIAAVAGWNRQGRVYRMLEKLELSLYRRSARVNVMTHSFVEDLTSRGVPAEKISVVINGADLSTYSPGPRNEALAADLGLNGKFVVGYLGTVGGAHALETAIEAAEILRDEDITLMIVGAGAAKDDLERLATEKGLRNVLFTGRKTKDEMPDYWSVVDTALIHLRNDPVFESVIPSKIFETMAMGRPILYGAPTGEGSRIVEEAEAGLMFPPETPQAMADAMRRLKNDAELRERLAANALAAAPRYSRERQAEDTMKSLQQATGGLDAAAPLSSQQEQVMK